MAARIDAGKSAARGGLNMEWDMTNFFKRFAQDESGAVTVDWVVLTAAAVGLALIVGGTVSTEIANVAKDIGDDMTASIGGARGTYDEDS